MMGVAMNPHEADPELVVDPDAVLSAPIPLQRFEPVGRRITQIFQSSCVIEHSEFAHQRSLDVDPAPYSLTFEKRLHIGITERHDHD
jgi:hypothetical protein